MTEEPWQAQRHRERHAFTPTLECDTCRARVPINGLVGTRGGGMICIPCAVGAQAASAYDESGGTDG